MFQLTVGKILFHFSTVNQAEHSYFASVNGLKSTQNKWKHSDVVKWFL